MDQLVVVSGISLLFYKTRVFRSVRAQKKNRDEKKKKGWTDRWMDGEVLWTKAEEEKKGKKLGEGQINKVLRPLSVLQVVFLLHTSAAYVTV